MKTIWLGVKKLELYECVGLLFSLLALALFVMYGDLIDAKQQIPGWHWYPVAWVWNVYRSFIPKAFAVSLLLFLALGLWKYRDWKWGVRQTFSLSRFAFPFCILLIIYRVLNFYIPLFSPIDHDDWLLQMDIRLFGIEPTVWLQRFIHPVLTDYLSFVYMVWFPLIFFTMLLMHLHSLVAVTNYTTSVLFSFYIGYFCYMLIPAVGPYYWLQQEYIFSLAGGVLTKAQTSLVVPNDFNVPRDAFPSLHTAVSCIMLWYIARYRRRWLLLYIPLVISILFSTIYLRYHYAIDVCAGIVLGVGTSYLGSWLSKKWRSRLS